MYVNINSYSKSAVNISVYINIDSNPEITILPNERNLSLPKATVIILFCIGVIICGIIFYIRIRDSKREANKSNTDNGSSYKYVKANPQESKSSSLPGKQPLNDDIKETSAGLINGD